VNKKLSYRKQIARQQRAHSNNSKFLGQGKFYTGEGVKKASIWDIDGGGRSRKHKFQCGIVSHENETFVTPLVAVATTAASLPTRPPQA